MKRVILKISASAQFKARYWRLKFMLQPSLKRALDVLCAVVAMALLCPLWVVVIVAIKFDSRGPVFFKQKRVGLDGALFTMWKFRSMQTDAENIKSALQSQNEMKNGVLFKMKKDPRITRVGGLIRKTSIDELPQLVNVLKGDMSLVGPRPPLTEEVAQYNRSDRTRLMVKPGITCLWQVSGRSDIPFKQQVKLDIDYIESQSIFLDVWLLIRTIPAVIFGKGAY